jgi:streptogramin lyase
VVNNGSNNVTVLNSSGAALFTPSVGTSPVGIAIDSSGNAWVTNSGSGTVTELSSSGITIGTYPVYTAGASPQGIAIDKNGNIWIANSGSCSVTELNSSGYPIGTYSLLTTNYNYCQYASSIAIDASGNVWVNSNYQVVKLSSTGNLIGSYSFGSIGWGIYGVGGIAIDASGNVWVDYYTYNGSTEVGVVTELSSTGNLIGSYSFGSNVNVNGVGGIAIDASGNIWVAGSVGGMVGVVELTPSGTVLGQYSTSGWGNYPGIAIDATGNVWETIPYYYYWNGTYWVYGGFVTEFMGATTGPQYFPYTGPQFAGGGNW